MALVADLANIVGVDYVTDVPAVCEKYSEDYSFVNPRMPSCVVYARDAGEVQAVVKYANDHLLAVTPRSSGVGFYGAGIPSQGGIALDLTRMNRILEVDGDNKRVKVEPGVTWVQLQEELKRHGLMVCNPLLPHPLKSVLTSSMEREPILIPKGEYSDTFETAEIVLPDGEIYYTGTAIGRGMKGGNFPEGMIPSTRLFLGAQGTLGIITWANIKAEWLPTVDKVFLIPFTGIDSIIEPVYRIQRRMLGNECLVLNSLNLAAILAQGWPDEFEAFRKTLPPWTLILCLSGLNRLPEEKIEYEEEALRDVAAELGFSVSAEGTSITGLKSRLSGMLRKPWPGDVYWKFRHKGSCHDIFFYTTLNRVAEFTDSMGEVAAKYNYPTADIGFYLQPVERGRACFCQYGFHCDPGDAEDVARVRSLYLEASELAISMGGIFTTPYGYWADMVYSRTAAYTDVMRLVKDALDPNNIMNPGRLCF
ncbi:MAG: FAD-binding oxidoreductase [Chloroflexota bacterium]